MHTGELIITMVYIVVGGFVITNRLRGSVVMEEDDSDLVFDSILSPNDQVTVKKSTRDFLELDPGDRIYLKVIRVVQRNGDIKYPTE